MASLKAFLEAVIFDMDGLMVDSEPFWREAEPKVLQSIGIPLTAEMCSQTKGRRVDEVVNHWKAKFPGDYPSTDLICSKIEDEVEALILRHGEALPGLWDCLEMFKAWGLRLAIASSSSLRLINAVIKRLQIEDLLEFVQSAENLAFGKPHPEIYRLACQRFGVKVENILVFEDSLVGLRAAKAAGLKVCIVPEADEFAASALWGADLRVRNLKEIGPSMIEGHYCIRKTD